MERFLVPFMLVLALIANGCAKKSSDPDDVYMDDQSEMADTATVEDNPELPDAGDANVATGGGMDTPELPPESGDTSTASAEMPAAEVPPSDSMVSGESGENYAAAPTFSNDSSDMSATGTGVIDNYTVQRGDTLMKIAFNLYGDIDQWRTIYNLNKDVLNGVKSLRTGQSLKFDKPSAPPSVAQNGEPYLIKQGDTLGTISNDVYATPKKWRRLYENNRQLIKDPNRIYAGFYLYYQITEEEKLQVQKLRAANEATDAAMSKAAPLAPGMNVGRAPASLPAAPAAVQPAPATK